MTPAAQGPSGARPRQRVVNVPRPDGAGAPGTQGARRETIGKSPSDEPHSGPGCGDGPGQPDFAAGC